jgi:hypothetical protein
MSVAGWLKRVFTVSRPRARPAGPSTPIAAELIAWRDDTDGVPIPDWDATAHAPHAPHDDAPFVEADAFWSGAARAWLDALRAHWGVDAYAVMESPEFMLLAALPPNLRHATLGYAESTRKRVLDALPGIAAEEGYGKTLILVVDSVQRYYEYVSHYYGANEGKRAADGAQELSQSGGMFINAGYGHFVFVADEDMRLIEGTIAHELTHALVRHLPLPAWLNEGIAVNVERLLCGHRPRETVQELLARHRAHWNADTIQEFWSGKSWLRAGDSNELSYELAATFAQLAGTDWRAFTAFVNAADASDAGESAARAHLGHPLAQLVASMLGDGDWAPQPARWQGGVEAGGFARAHVSR